MADSDIDAILEKIREIADAQIQEIRQGAQDRAREILARAESEADRIREAARASALAPAQRERARLLHQAHLQALDTLGRARQGLVDRVLAETRSCLASLRSKGVYEQVLEGLVREAVDELRGSLTEGDQALLEADPADREMVGRFLEGSGLDPSLSFELKCWGGANARSGDGRVVVKNTLEARLERATPFLQRFLSGLFAPDDERF